MTTAQAFNRLALVLPLVALAGCDLVRAPATQPPPAAATRAPAAPSGVTETALQRPASARSVASLDASAAEKAAASRPAAAGARLGTPIASLASLITLKIYLWQQNARPGRFLAVFTLYNLIGLAALLTVALVF